MSNKKILKCLVISAMILLGGSYVHANQEFMPVSEVKEGMHGYAKTVIHGTKIDTFYVDVMGVMKKQGNTGGDLILVKVSGPVIDESNGIAQGMSGSPVYINGKLLGAVAYGFSNSGGRIGMVTPISDMLGLWTIDDNKKATSHTLPDGLIPIKTPLMSTGYTEDAIKYLEKRMKDFNMYPLSAATSSVDEIARPLEAGGAVAATMVTGDLKLGAVGTVTYVDKDHIVAFGHPFRNTGNTSYFMNNSYIFTVIPSTDTPFKLASVGADIGEITQDRVEGIAGINGIIPDFASFHAYVKDKDTGEHRNLNVKMIQDEKIIASLTSTSAYSAVNSTINRKGEGTVTLKYTLYPKDLKKKPFTRSNMFWSSVDISEKSVEELHNAISILAQNQFEKFPLRSITLDAEVTKERKTAQLLDATAAPTIVSPGDMIYIRVRLQSYRGNIFYKDLTFTVPKNQPLGEMTLEVRGGGVVPLPYLIQQQQLNFSDEVIDRLRKYKDFDDLFNKLEESDQNNQIVVEILNTDSGMPDKKIDKKVENLEAKEENNNSKSKTRLKTDYIVYGDGQFTFQVMNPSDKDKELKKLTKEKRKVKLDFSKDSSENPTA